MPLLYSSALYTHYKALWLPRCCTPNTHTHTRTDTQTETFLLSFHLFLSLLIITGVVASQHTHLEYPSVCEKRSLGISLTFLLRPFVFFACEYPALRSHIKVVLWDQVSAFTLWGHCLWEQLWYFLILGCNMKSRHMCGCTVSIKSFTALDVLCFHCYHNKSIIVNINLTSFYTHKSEITCLNRNTD